jgi:hypothetical protein
MLKLFKILMLFCIFQSAFAAYNQNVALRVAVYSKEYLGRPYQLYPIGEGKAGIFDQNPLYRTDVFDCFSYVTYVLALAESKNANDFKQNYIKINYLNSKVAFENRFHFTNDWNKANAKNGYLVDITNKITNENGEKIYQISSTFINKPAWFEHLTAERIHLIKPPSSEQLSSLLMELHALSRKVQPEISIIPYIPITSLFTKNGEANKYIFAQIPSGSIIEIVRSNWDLTKTIGTKIDISHIGFAIMTKQGLMFREASNSPKWGKGVIDVPLIAYLQNIRNIKSISGINIEMPIDPP